MVSVATSYSMLSAVIFLRILIVRYALDKVPITVSTNEALLPGHDPILTQRSISLYLQPLTRELTEVPNTPTIAELPGPVIDRMVLVDKAFWVDKPGSNAYNIDDAYYRYGMTTQKVLPPHQDVFPRSYQYDLDCVKYRRQNACLAMNNPEYKRKPAPHCRDCGHINVPGLTPFQLAWAQDEGQRRWRYYPDLSATMPKQEIRTLMKEVGQPFRNEACNWYNENYPSVKYNCIVRKFSK